LGASRMTNGSAVQDSGVDTMPRLASAFTAVLCPPRVHMCFSSSLSRMTSVRPPDGMRSKTTPLRPQGRSSCPQDYTCYRTSANVIYPNP
jgi:hypothetical protein